MRPHPTQSHSVAEVHTTGLGGEPAEPGVRIVTHRYVYLRRDSPGTPVAAN